MKLEAVNSRMSAGDEGFPAKDVRPPADAPITLFIQVKSCIKIRENEKEKEENHSTRIQNGFLAHEGEKKKKKEGKLRFSCIPTSLMTDDESQE